jgi:hypothetical protein
MIVGGKIEEISGKKTSEEGMKGLNINIELDSVKVKGEDVEMKYTYTASYAENLGDLTIKGVLYAKEEKKLAKEIDEEWKKSKKLPDAYAEIVLNAVNYTGSANGTLIARVLNLSPPLVPPRIQIKK